MYFYNGIFYNDTIIQLVFYIESSYISLKKYVGKNFDIMRQICYKSSYSDPSCLNLFLFLWKKFKLGEVTNMWISHAQFLKFLVTLKENIFYKKINIYIFFTNYFVEK